MSKQGNDNAHVLYELSFCRLSYAHLFLYCNLKIAQNGTRNHAIWQPYTFGNHHHHRNKMGFDPRDDYRQVYCDRDRRSLRQPSYGARANLAGLEREHVRHAVLCHLGIWFLASLHEAVDHDSRRGPRRPIVWAPGSLAHQGI